MNNAFYIIVQRINLYEIFHTKDTNLFHRHEKKANRTNVVRRQEKWFPTVDTKEDEDEDKKRKRERKGKEEKIDGGQSKHPEETAFRTGIKVIAER